MSTYLYVTIGFLIFSGCSSIHEHRLHHQNPTSYQFPFGRETVVRAIKTTLGKSGFRSMNLQWCDQVSTSHMFIPDLCDSSDKNKAFLYADFENPIGTSTYYRGSKPLPFYSDYLLNIEPVTEELTLVSITGKNTHVVTGKTTTFGPCGLVRVNKTASVEPTTIEEYEILLAIGKELGLAEIMPPITYPE